MIGWAPGCAFVFGKPATVPANWTAFAEWFAEGHSYADFMSGSLADSSNDEPTRPRAENVRHEFSAWMESEAGVDCCKKHNF